MKTSFKKLSDTRVELTVTLDAKDLEAAIKQATERLAKDVKVEGFRQGKVPVEIAKKFIPENDLNATALDIAVRTTVLPAFSENEKALLAVPTVDVTKYVPGEMVEYTAKADIVPDIKLGDYHKLGVKKDKISITDENVNTVLDNLSRAYATKKAIKRAAAKDDEVIIDFVGKKDGEAFRGGSAKDHKLILGSGAFIPGFEDGIIGHEPGDKFDLNLTFPKDYGVAELAGEAVVFEILLKQVNELKNHPLDDDLAQKAGNFKDLDALKADIRTNLTREAEYRAGEKFKNELVKALVEKSKIPTPEILVEDQMNLLRDDVSRNAAAQNLDFAELLKRTGQTEETWEKEARKVAEDRVKASLALQNVAVKEKIAVSEDTVNAKIAELREIYKKSPEAVKSLKDPNVKMDIRNRLMVEATLDFLVKANEKDSKTSGKTAKTAEKGEKTAKKDGKTAKKK